MRGGVTTAEKIAEVRTQDVVIGEAIDEDALDGAAA